MRVLITGGAGFLGSNLCRRLRDGGHEVWATRYREPLPAGVTGPEVDLERPGSLAQAAREVSPELVIHTAAMVHVGACERDPERAGRVNVEATGELCDALAAQGGRLVQLSTDLVYDGARGDYREDDLAQPVMEYGRSKLAADARVLASSLARKVIARVALMYGAGPPAHRSFIGWLDEGLRSADGVGLFADEWRTPVYVEDVCDALCALVVRPEAEGVYHLAGPERVDRATFGEVYAEVFGLEAGRIRRSSLSELEGSAHPPRPADVSLNIERARRDLGYAPRTVRAALMHLRGLLCAATRPT
jgi:dTDP-4-dehydrorhamnose reductase